MGAALRMMRAATMDAVRVAVTVPQEIDTLIDIRVTTVAALITLATTIAVRITIAVATPSVPISAVQQTVLLAVEPGIRDQNLRVHRNRTAAIAADRETLDLTQDLDSQRQGSFKLKEPSFYLFAPIIIS